MIPQKPIIILGAGGHAQVLVEALRCMGLEMIGVVTPDLPVGFSFADMTVLGDDNVVFDHLAEDIYLVNGVGSLPYQDIRWRLSEQFRREKYKFVNVTHPTAIVASDVRLDEGVQVMAGVILQSGAKVGCDSIVNTKVSIDHNSVVGKCCHLAPGVTVSGDVTIGDYCHVGPGSCVIQGVTIGDGTVIGAGSVVYEDVPCNSRYIQKRSILI
ncbi:acetyltransferase [Desulforhopalus sp. 52FAK]